MLIKEQENFIEHLKPSCEFDHMNTKKDIELFSN